MAKKLEVKERIIKGNELVCAVCKNDTFWARETLMNTVGMTILKLDWANKKAQNYVCDNCGYVHWFLSK
jgi:predicted nucleic-acid-binding Zn-ribbon protein